MAVKDKELLSLPEAFNAIADGLIKEKQADIKLGSFWEFVRDIWSKSYEKPYLFNMWYIELICTEVEQAINLILDALIGLR